MTNTKEKAVLTDEETLKEVVDCLKENISIKTQSNCQQTDLFNILVGAASNADTIENTASTLKKSWSGRNVRYHLSKFKSFKELEKELNQALITKLPSRIKKRWNGYSSPNNKVIAHNHQLVVNEGCYNLPVHKLAIDFNLIPYYGQPTKEEQDYIYRSQAKNGTCSFYAYATLYIISNNKRLTIAIIGIKKSYTNAAIITYLLDKIQSLNLKIKTLYLDRGFYSSSVIRWLIALDIPFIMPAIKNGQTGGINQYLTGKKSYKTTHTLIPITLWERLNMREGTIKLDF